MPPVLTAFLVQAVLYPFIWSDDAKERMPSAQQMAATAKTKATAREELERRAASNGLTLQDATRW